MPRNNFNKRSDKKSAKRTAPSSVRRRQPGIPPHLIVFVPGFLGSTLRNETTGETVWIDFSRVPLNPLEWGKWLDHLLDSMRYPNDRLKPAGIVDDVVFALPWIKQEQYSRFLRRLEELGYRTDPAHYSEKELDVYTFPYDWRQDNRISARQLKQAIERWRKFHPRAKVWLIAHSNGGVVSRWYIEKEGGNQHVGRLILLASPWDGAVKGMYMLFNGLDSLFRKGFDVLNISKRTREVLRTFPSLYQLIPHKQEFLQASDGTPMNPFAGQDWLDEPQYHQLLADAKKFNRELGDTLSVDTLVFFGRKQPTTTRGIVHLSAGTKWDSIDWLSTEQGDGTLLEHSTVFPQARQNIPIVASHGDIYVNPALDEILRWELIDQYKPRATAIAERQGIAVNFNSERDTYTPGNQINLWATVQSTDGTPVSNARIKVRLEWRQKLPGSRKKPKPKNLPSVQLEATQTPGRYEGSLRAPQNDGYYQLTATVRDPSNKQITLHELIVIE